MKSKEKIKFANAAGYCRQALFGLSAQVTKFGESRYGLETGSVLFGIRFAVGTSGGRDRRHFVGSRGSNDATFATLLSWPFIT